jgi:3-oxoacyl-[acyl-carrier-protein] synthase II
MMARPSPSGPPALVTGLGVISSCGQEVEDFWQALLEGRSGISHLERIDTEGLRTRFGGEVKDFAADRFMAGGQAKRMDRFSQYAVAAARMAMHDAGFSVSPEESFRVGVVLGTGIGGMETLVDQLHTLEQRGPRRVSPYFIPMMIANMAGGQVSMILGARGPCATVTTACASAGNAIGDALRLIQHGEADVVICGGTEAPFTRLAVAGFGAAHTLSTRNDDPERASRPFDAGRDGFVMSEGAGMLVIESEAHARARGARAYARLAGCSMTADASHVTAPAPDGLGRYNGMRQAIADAGLALEDLGYINAHGTSTPTNDKDESQVIKRLFGPAVPPVSSTKSVTGHLLGAAGAVEAIACVLAINRGILPPTTNYEQPDPDCDLDYVPNQPRKSEIGAAISNSFGFGGQNAILTFTAAPDTIKRTEPARPWPGLSTGEPVPEPA